MVDVVPRVQWTMVEGVYLGQIPDASLYADASMSIDLQCSPFLELRRCLLATKYSSIYAPKCLFRFYGLDYKRQGLYEVTATRRDACSG